MPLIDTDERKAVLRKLCDALYDYLALPILEMEREAARIQSAQNFPMPDGALPASAIHIPSKLEQLSQAQESVEQIREQIEQMEEAASRDDCPGFMRTYLQSVLLTPLRQQLKDREQWLPQIQARLEEETAGR